MSSGPALVSILRQGSYLIASIHTALDDAQMLRFQNDLIQQIGEHRARGVIIDVAALDVLDSFGSRTLRNRRNGPASWRHHGHRGHPARRCLRDGAARDGHRVRATALDLEEGLAYLDRDLRPPTLRRPESPWRPS